MPAKDSGSQQTSSGSSTLVEEIREGQVDTLDSNTRYLAYAGRLRALLVASSRYLAYTSDVGEAFRPVAHPYLVTSAYAISFGYVGLDVLYEGYKAKYIRHRDNWLTANLMTKRAVFQIIASMALPSLTIHTTVNLTNKLFQRIQVPKAVRTWGPTALGLLVVPTLPVLFDEPVERGIDRLWDRMLPAEERSHHEHKPKTE